MTTVVPRDLEAKSDVGLYLFQRGWYLRNGWRHPLLNGGLYPWPGYLAARLSSEAFDMKLDEPVHRMLRGEEKA